MMKLVKDFLLESENFSLWTEISNSWRCLCGNRQKQNWIRSKCFSHLVMELGERSDFWQQRLTGIQQHFGNLCCSTHNSFRS